MAVTSPDNIRTPDNGSQYALVQDMGAQADSTQAAIIKRANLYVGTTAQRVAFTSAPNGVHWQDTDGSQGAFVRRSGAWRPSGTPAVSSSAARDILIPSPVQNDSVFRSDTGWTENYFALYNATNNPGGATPAGWYPVSGLMPFAQISRSDTATSLTASAWVNYSANTIWSVPGAKTNGFVPYNAGWTVPFSGRYLAEASLTSKGAAMFGGLSLDPSTAGRASLMLENTTGTVAFSIGKLSLVGTLELNAGDKVYIKSTSTTATDMGLWRSSEAQDAGRFNLTYVGPKR